MSNPGQNSPMSNSYNNALNRNVKQVKEKVGQNNIEELDSELRERWGLPRSLSSLITKRDKILRALEDVNESMHDNALAHNKPSNDDINEGRELFEKLIHTTKDIKTILDKDVEQHAHYGGGGEKRTRNTRRQNLDQGRSGSSYQRGGRGRPMSPTAARRASMMRMSSMKQSPKEMCEGPLGPGGRGTGRSWDGKHCYGPNNQIVF